MIGRDRELAFLCEHVKARRPVAVCGTPGLGKTALMRAVTERVNAHAFEGGGLSALKWMSYLPLARAFGMRPPASDQESVADWVVERLGRDVLVLDDAQWADQDTLGLLRFLTNRIPLLIGIRSGEPGADSIQTRARRLAFEQIELGPLTRHDIVEMLARRWHDLPSDDVERIADISRGNPYLAEELARNGGHSPTFRLSARARIRRLSPDAREILALLGLGGHAVDRDPLPEAVEELVRADLATAAGGRVAISYPFFGAIAVEQLDAAVVRSLHGRIAREVSDPGEAARHFAEAGESSAAYAKAVEAAVLAEDPDEQASHLAIAGACASGPGSGPLRLRAANALSSVGRFEAAKELLMGIEASNAIAAAEVGLRLAHCSIWLGEFAGAREASQRSLEVVNGMRIPLEAELRTEEARLSLFARDAARGIRLARDASVLARTLGSDEATARFLTGWEGFLSYSPSCVDDFRSAVDLARDKGDAEMESEAAATLVQALDVFAAPADARAWAERMETRARALRLRAWEGVFRYLRARLDFDQAGIRNDTIHRLEELVRGFPLGPYRDSAVGLLARTLAYVGRETEARGLIAKAIAGAGTVGARAALLLVQIEIEWLVGRSNAALSAVQQLRATALPGHEDLLALGRLAEMWALVDLEQTPGPPLRHASYPSIEGAVAESHALALDRESGQLDAIEARFEEAASSWAGHSLAAEARCRWAAGEAARLSGAADRAGERLAEVEELVRRSGLVALLGRVHGSLRRAGMATESGAAARTSRGDLTPREREILRLVGAGLSSRDIARVLAVAQPTVETQVRSAMRKLGASTRVQAATLVWFRREDALIRDADVIQRTGAGQSLPERSGQILR